MFLYERKENFIRILGCLTCDGVIKVPEQVEGLPVTELAPYVFSSGTGKDEVMEKNLLAASHVPIRIMEKTGRTLEILEALVSKGSRLAVSDVGVAVAFVRAALLGAVMNVYINTKSMKNREKAEELNQYAERMIAEGSAHADAIYEQVLASLR